MWTANQTHAEKPGAKGRSTASLDLSTSTTVSKTAIQNLRVDVGKLDRMLNLTVEFAIAQGRQRRILEEKLGLVASGREVLEYQRRLEALFLALQQLETKIRMVPVGPTFPRFPRSVRDGVR